MAILHCQFDRKQVKKCDKDDTWNKVFYPDVSPTKQMRFHTNLKLMSIITTTEMTPSLSIVSNEIDISLARLIARCACFVFVGCSLLPQVRRNAQHRARTHNGNSTLCSLLVFRIQSCVLFLGMHIGSGSWTELRMKSCLCHVRFNISVRKAVRVSSAKST